MSRLCSFGRSVIGIVESHIEVENDDFYISDEWRLYHEIEDLFTGDGWIAGGEAFDLRSRIDELEGEVVQLEGDNVGFEDEISRLLGEVRDLEEEISELRTLR